MPKAYKIVRLIVLSFFITGFQNCAFAEDFPKKMVDYELVIKKSKAGDYVSNFEMLNRGEKLEYVYRPSAKSNTFSIGGLGEIKNISFKGSTVFEDFCNSAIPLRPNCKMNMDLGKIIIKNEKGQKMNPVVGTYPAETLTGDTNNIATVEVAERYAPAFTVGKDKEETFLQITVEPVSESSRLGGPVLFNVSFSNQSDRPLKFFNYFHLYGYKEYLKFNIELIGKDGAVDNNNPILVSAITPDALDDWMILLPGESLSTVIDANEEFKAPGDYLISVTFHRGDVVIYPKDGKPYYSQKRQWDSNKVSIKITAKD